MYILRLGSMDVKGLLKAVGEDGFLKHVSCLLQKCKLRVVIHCLNVFFLSGDSAVTSPQDLQSKLQEESFVAV